MRTYQIDASNILLVNKRWRSGGEGGGGQSLDSEDYSNTVMIIQLKSIHRPVGYRCTIYNYHTIRPRP